MVKTSVVDGGGDGKLLGVDEAAQQQEQSKRCNTVFPVLHP